jgi:CRISPR-associated endonuclease Csn1
MDEKVSAILNMRQDEEYFIGLDCGTTSVGWAVTNTNYEIPKLRGKSAWGVRLFQEGQTAANRRVNRSVRLRYKRRAKRMRWLEKLFSEEIAKVDPHFLDALRESKFWLEDKRTDSGEHLNLKHTLFNDDDYTDKDFYADFPTIYHLRAYLQAGDEEARMQVLSRSPKKLDIRHYYIAIHHILKTRGHFLFEGKEDFSVENGFDDLFFNFSQVLEEVDVHYNVDLDGAALKELLLEQIGKNDKKRKMKELFEESEQIKEEKTEDSDAKGAVNPAKVAELLATSAITLHDLANRKLEEGDEKVSFSILDSDEKLEQVLGEALSLDERLYTLIVACKQLVDYAILHNLLKGEKSVSKAFVNLYKQHTTDLRALKEMFAEHFTKGEAKEFFKKDYAAYVGNFDKRFRNKLGKSASKYEILKGKKNYEPGTINEKIKKLIESKFSEVNKLDDFGDVVTKDGKTVKTRNMPESVQKLYDKAVEGELLPKQCGTVGSTIPFQLHHVELFNILQNMAQGFPFIEEQLSDETSSNDDTFIMKAEKTRYRFDCIARRVLQLHRFRIPYYIGHLNHHQESGIIQCQLPWVVREDGEVTPWNFDATKGGLVNLDASAEGFIKRMTNKCTYLREEDVLAKNSVLYSKFSLLNELNNLKIDGVRILPELKQKLFDTFYVRKKTNSLSGTAIKKWLKEENIPGEVSGLNGTIKGNYNSYHDYENVLSDDKTDATLQQFEKIIEYVMLLKESTPMLKSRIEKDFGELSDERWEKIRRLNYSGWGRLSQKLLQDIKVPVSTLDQSRLYFGDDFSPQDISIIEAMEFGNYNLQELVLSSSYGFQEKIREENGDATIEGPITYAEVDKYYASPSVKKMVWQTVKVVEELRKVAGHNPKKIMIEMARSEETKKQTESRKKQLEDIYKTIKNDTDAANMLAKLKELPEDRLKAKNLYLYYTQMGKCMYCGESIDEESLKTGNGIDIDHIWPRSKTKDDSLTNNLILVHTSGNRAKGDSDRLRDGLCGNGKSLPKWLWARLKGSVKGKQGLITNEKYDRLTRVEELSVEELQKFINRQLVETRQSTKIVAELLGRAMPETEIIYVKGGDVSTFRQEYDIIKVREMNDLHHAKDAFLNVVVGNVMHEKFTKRWYSKGKYNESRFEEDKRGDRIPSLNFHAIFGDGKARPKAGYGEQVFAEMVDEIGEWPEKGSTRDDVQSYREEVDNYLQWLVNKSDSRVYTSPQPFTDKDGVLVWSYEEHGSKTGTIALQAKKNDIIVSEEVYEGNANDKGAFWDAMPIRKGGGGNIPLKTGDKRFENISKYGNYNSIKRSSLTFNNNAFGFISARDAKKVNEHVIDGMKVKLNTLFILNGYPYRLSSDSELKSVYQAIYDEYSQKYLKKIVKNAALKVIPSEEILRDRDGVTKGKNLEIYNMFLRYLNTATMKKRIGNFADKMKSGSAKFEQLPVDKQVRCLYQILIGIAPGKTNATYKDVGLDRAGRISNFTIKKDTTAILITQSVTGLYENRIDLKKLSEGGENGRD